MPTISMFYGIIVRMYREVGGQHNLPHIHAEYQGSEVVISLDDELHYHCTVEEPAGQPELGV